MNAAFWGFRAATRIRFLSGYADLPLPTRRRWAEQWAYGPLGLGRQLFRAVRATSLVAYYEQSEVRARVTSGGGTTNSASLPGNPDGSAD